VHNEARPLFKECTIDDLSLPLFKCGVMKYNGMPVFGNRDWAHSMKRNAAHFRGGRRKTHILGVFVDNVHLLRGGIGFRTWMGVNGQSTKQAVSMNNPGYFTNQWDDIGTHLSALLNGLVFGPWGASRIYSMEETFLNAMSGYYFVLVNVYIVYTELGPSKWENYFFFC